MNVLGQLTPGEITIPLKQLEQLQVEIVWRSRSS
jgi:hypothetical protein